MPQLIFLDSCDHLSTAQIPRKWTQPVMTVSVGGGRQGTNAYVRSSGADQSFKTYGPEYNTICAGAAYKTTAFRQNLLMHWRSPDPDRIVLQHVGDGRLRVGWDFGGPAGSVSCAVEVRINGETIPSLTGTVISGSSPMLGPSTDVVLTTNTYYYLELYASCPSLSFAMLGIQFPGGLFNNAWYDDFYVTDGTFLGDVHIRCLYPNANGAASAWTPKSLPNGYEEILEHPADDDVTYITAAASGLTELVNLDDITGFTGTIRGAQALNLLLKTDAGAAQVRSKIRNSGGTIQNFPKDFYPSCGGTDGADAWIYNIQPYLVSPFTGVNWTVSEINALQQGLERTV